MDIKKLKNCIAYCQRAYEELETAKQDCNTKVDAALLTYISEVKTKITTADKKAIKKIAKAKATDKMDDLKTDVAADVDLMEASGEIETGQLSLFGPLKRLQEEADKSGAQLEMSFGTDSVEAEIQ